MSQVTAKKSLNISSATGRRPVIAAPIAAPTIACSLIGVSTTRRGPNWSISPSVSLKTPPAAPTSSPISTTVSSRAISWAMPRATAWRYVVSGTIGPPGGATVGPHLGLDDGRGRLRAGPRECLGLGDLGSRLVVDRVQRGFVDATCNEPRALGGDGVAGLPRLDLLVRPVLAGIGAGVAAVAVGDGLDERRALAGPGPRDHPPRPLVDRLDVVAVDDDRLKPVRGGAVRGRPRDGRH